MEAFAVLADRYAQSKLADLGHSALPNAPQQPYHPRRRPLRAAVAAVRQRMPSASRRRSLAPVDCTVRPVRSP